MKPQGVPLGGKAQTKHLPLCHVLPEDKCVADLPEPYLRHLQEGVELASLHTAGRDLIHTAALRLLWRGDEQVR